VLIFTAFLFRFLEQVSILFFSFLSVPTAIVRSFHSSSLFLCFMFFHGRIVTTFALP
jgi:hypothetical protein